MGLRPHDRLTQCLIEMGQTPQQALLKGYLIIYKMVRSCTCKLGQVDQKKKVHSYLGIIKHKIIREYKVSNTLNLLLLDCKT